MPPGTKSRPAQWEPGVPDVSDAGTEAPDLGAPPPPPGSGAAPRTTTLPRPIPAQFTGAPLEGGGKPAPGVAPAPGIARTGDPPPPPVTAPTPARSPLMWALIAGVAGLIAFGLVFGLTSAIIFATR